MTVAIAVLCDDHESIVFACDRKATFADFSADHAAFKIVRLYRRHWVLSAGDDVEYAEDILREAGDALDAKEKLQTPKQVADALNDAYWNALHAQIESRVLRKHKFTVDSFRDSGSKKCTATVYNNLCAKIERVELSLRFMLIGFSASGRGHIYVVDGSESPKCYTSIGVWAIGSGEHAALSSLAFHIERSELSKYRTSTEDAVYFACEAKFMAESSGHVGKDDATVGIVSSRDKDPSEIALLPSQDLARVKELWKTQGAPRVPPNIGNLIKGMMRKSEDDAPKQSTPETSTDQQ
jgi:20S proteasome alpha/beta subunit